MLQGSGNAVPQGHHAHGHESDSESYTGSSGSYSETGSHGRTPPPPQQLQQPAASQSASKSQRVDNSTFVQPTAAAYNSHQTPAAQQFDQEDEGNGNNKKGKRGADKAKNMVNAALNAPAARMRAVTASIAGRDSQRVTVYVFFCVSFVHLLFVILSCTLSQVDVQGGGCYTFWGYKSNCDAVSYTRRTALMTDCGPLRSSLQAGAAFSILSIMTSTAVFFLAWMMCGRLRHAIYVARHQNRYRNVDAGSLAGEDADREGESGNKGKKQEEPPFNPGQLKLVTMVVVGISLVFELIAWAVIAGINTKHYCDLVYDLSITGTYGVGFGLGLTAWILEILAFAVYVAVL